MVAMVRSGRRTFRPRSRSIWNACGVVTSWTQVQVDVEQRWARPAARRRRGCPRFFRRWCVVLHKCLANCFADFFGGGGLAFRSQIRRHAARVEHFADRRRSRPSASFISPNVYSSIAATVPIAPSGLALFWPAMSGAEPCTGSYKPFRCRRARPRAACRWSRPESAHIAQDIAERVFGQHHVELRGLQHHLHGGVVHQHVIELDVGILLGDVRSPLCARTARFRARWICRRWSDLLAAIARQLERRVRHALDLGARVGHGVEAAVAVDAARLRRSRGRRSARGR